MADERFVKIFDDLIDVLKEFIRRDNLTYGEYHAAVRFLHEAGQAGEMPLLLDVFLETTVNDVNFVDRAGTAHAIEGPYYVEGAPELSAPYELPHRDDEPGDPLIFAGTVTSVDGTRLAGVLLNLWQADADGRYSNVAPEPPPYNLRGKIRTDGEGRFEVRTFVPAPYEIPKTGPTGRLLEALGRHAFRPAHLHLTITHPGYTPLTTQIFFEGGEWVNSDVVDAVKDSLIAKLEPTSQGDMVRYDFTLVPAQ